jgi:hypothetical protein
MQLPLKGLSDFDKVFFFFFFFLSVLSQESLQRVTPARSTLHQATAVSRQFTISRVLI